MENILHLVKSIDDNHLLVQKIKEVLQDEGCSFAVCISAPLTVAASALGIHIHVEEFQEKKIEELLEMHFKFFKDIVLMHVETLKKAKNNSTSPQENEE